MKISDKQREMLAFIETFIEKNGYPPTYEEIRQGLNISSKSLVNYHLEVLENAALLKRSPNTPRGIRLNSESETVQVPFMGRIAAGPPTDFVEDNNREAIELTCTIVPNRADLFALKVEGDSMIDALVNHGDIVIMQHQVEAQNGEMVAVRLIDQNETTLKRFYRENGHVRLQPANPKMEPIFVSPESVAVQGKVVAIIRQVE
ncbi:MAG: transcriptional repressor LexA [Anaerolineae bacterium]|nr:transcriptional repressor LexA [Anaerolineae bacterium]